MARDSAATSSVAALCFVIVLIALRWLSASVGYAATQPYVLAASRPSASLYDHIFNVVVCVRFIFTFAVPVSMLILSPKNSENVTLSTVPS